MAGRKARASSTRKAKYAAHFAVAVKNKIARIEKHIRRAPNDGGAKDALSRARAR